MVISTRTPEGSPNRCPLCGSEVRIEPSQPFGDAPCPVCGHLLWFLRLHSEPHFFANDQATALRERVLNIVAENLGINKESLAADPSFRKEIGADFLDIVELVMELEEEVG